VTGQDSFAQKRNFDQTETMQKRIRKSEKRNKRKQNQLFTRKQKSDKLEKSFFKSRGTETSSYQGNIWLQPKGMDTKGMQSKTERNPSRKNLRAFRAQQNTNRRSSAAMQKSLGGSPVSRENKSLAYKYYSKRSQSYQGNRPAAAASKPDRSQTRRQTTSPGNLKLKPRSMARDYNAIRERTEPNPSRTRQISEKQQQSRMKKQSGQIQQSTGNIPVVRKEKQLLREFKSKQQLQSGTLKARDVKNRNAASRNISRSSSAYSGEMPGTDRKAVEQWSRSESKRMLRYSGAIKSSSHKAAIRNRQSVSGQASAYQGDFKARSRQMKSREGKYSSQMVSGYSGDQKVKQGRLTANYRMRSQGQQQHTGDVPVFSKRDRKLHYEYQSQTSQNFSGNLKSRKRVSSSGMASRMQGGAPSYQGDVKALSSKQKEYKYQYLSKHEQGFQGNIKTRSSGSRGQAGSQHLYQGELKGPTYKDRQLNYQIMSRQAQTYPGSIRQYSEKSDNKYLSRISAQQHQHAGEVPIKAQKEKRLEYEYSSQLMHNFQGNIKMGKKQDLNRLHKRLSKDNHLNPGSLKARSLNQQNRYHEERSKNEQNFQGNIKVRHQDQQVKNRIRQQKIMGNYQGDIVIPVKKQRELTAEYMSKVAHNYKGDNRGMSQKEKARYYRETSARNNQITGNYRLKTRFVRDREFEILSARVQNFQGGPKTSTFNRWFHRIFDNGDKAQKAEYKSKKPRYDSRERDIWYY
jgi:hypothetical protein